MIIVVGMIVSISKMYPEYLCMYVFVSLSVYVHVCAFVCVSLCVGVDSVCNLGNAFRVRYSHDAQHLDRTNNFKEKTRTKSPFSISTKII